MADPLAIGVIGAGPWVRFVTGPVFAAGPETRLAGIWSRTRANAEAAAEPFGAAVFDDVDGLLDHCDAVAIAVAPGAQPDFAIRAAERGKAVLLEKPLALDLAEAERLADALTSRGTPNLLTLTNRFNPALPSFAEAAAAFDAFGGRGCFVSGALLPGGPFATDWRLDRGALLDVGPHLLDLHEIALGEIVAIDASGDVQGWTSLTLHHASGVTSQASICCKATGENRTEVEVFGATGSLRYDGRAGNPAETFANLRRTFVAVAGGTPHPADVTRGLHLQRLIANAEAQLAG